ncbi:MAG: hypothetical protein WCO09_04760 [bacterium]
MKNDIKILLTIIAIIIIGAIVYYKVSEAPSTIDNISATTTETQKGDQTQTTSTDTNSASSTSEIVMSDFTDSHKTFSFEYNSLFNATDTRSVLSKDWNLNAKQNGIILAKVTAPKTYMPNTNFSEAFLTVGRSADKTAIKTCTTAATNGEVKAGTTTISGYMFAKVTANDAGAGNFYESVIYRGIVGGNCYAIQYTIHSTNIGNYSPDQGITAFDKTKIQTDLENIVSSFKFLISSN